IAWSRSRRSRSSFRNSGKAIPPAVDGSWAARVTTPRQKSSATNRQQTWGIERGSQGDERGAKILDAGHRRNLQSARRRFRLTDPKKRTVAASASEWLILSTRWRSQLLTRKKPAARCVAGS